jgi:hypothetical protein
MAKVVLIGLEKSAACQIERALRNENHLIENRSLQTAESGILDADIREEKQNRNFLPVERTNNMSLCSNAFAPFNLIFHLLL